MISPRTEKMKKRAKQPIWKMLFEKLLLEHIEIEINNLTENDNPDYKSLFGS